MLPSVERTNTVLALGFASFSDEFTHCMSATVLSIRNGLEVVICPPNAGRTMAIDSSATSAHTSARMVRGVGSPVPAVKQRSQRLQQRQPEGPRKLQPLGQPQVASCCALTPISRTSAATCP